MADTQRTFTEIIALMPDQSTGDISPQDMRDVATTLRMGMGQLYVAAADAGSISIASTATYYECSAVVWTLSGGGLWFDESGGNGRLTYTGAANVMVHVACTVSFTTAQNNRTIHWRIAKNGTTDAASEAQRRVSTATDVGSTALHLVTSLSNGDYLSLYVRNATNTDDVTIQCSNLQAVSMAAT